MSDPLAGDLPGGSETHKVAGDGQRAQRFVGAAMTTCLACWFMPIVSGAICSSVEAALIDKVLKIMDCHTKENSNRIYWFFRKKTVFLFAGTYAPFVGVPLQLFETYGLGQFAIHCALKPELLQDDAWLEESWNLVAPDIFSGEHAVHSYEQFTGLTFPDHARKKFIFVVDLINTTYLGTQKIPGAMRAQAFIGNSVQGATRGGKWVLKLAGAGAGLSVVVAIEAGKAAARATAKTFRPRSEVITEDRHVKEDAKLRKKAAEQAAQQLTSSRYQALKAERAANSKQPV